MTRRIVYMLLVVAAVSFVRAPGAPAAEFGSRFLQSSVCCDLYGTRAAIDNVSLLPVDALVAARVEADDPSTGHLIQAGFIKTAGSISWSECPSVSDARYRFYEVLRAAVLGGTECNKYSNTSATRASVCRNSSGNTYWGAHLDGVNRWSGDVGFTHQQANVLAGGEIGEAGGANQSSTTARYGYGGTYPWVRFTSVGCATWVTVASSSTFNTGGWVIGSLPSPFVISWG